MDIGRWIDRHAGFTPDKAALRFAGADIPYAELAARIDGAARALVHELGLFRGDRIAYLGFNSPDQIVLTLAAARAGLVIVPLNWRLAAPELAFILGDCGVKALFLERAFEGRLGAEGPELRRIGTDAALGGAPSLPDLIAGVGGSAVAQGQLEDPLLLCYTSGTTGRPKGAILSQGAVQWNALNARHMHDMTAADHVLTVLPMFHVGGLNIQTLPALYCGATVTLHPRFDPDETLRAFAEARPSLTVQVPATLEALMRHPDWPRADLSSLRAIATGSTDVPTPLIRACHDHGVPVIQIYGSTETAPVAVYQKRADAETRFGSIGRPGLHTEIRLVDSEGREVADGEPGEILVRGPHVASGYWNDPQRTVEVFRDGWFHSGDVAHRDAEGWLWFRDRIKNVIISGGENIYPAEIERVLRDLPGVQEAAVVGRPDARWGEVPVAVVVRDAAGLSKDDMMAAFDGALARYKHPKDIVIAESLPRNAMGKVELAAVRELAVQGATLGPR